MKKIEQTYTIKAPRAKVWQALTNADIAQQWGAGPAKVEAVVGGEFSYWDGDIHGIYTRLTPEKLIEQDWYGHEHPGQKFKATFAFTAEGDITTVHFTFEGEFKSKKQEIKDWQDYYFAPIKELLEAEGS